MEGREEDCATYKLCYLQMLWHVRQELSICRFGTLGGPYTQTPQTRGPRTRCFAQLRTSSHSSRWELLISASSLLAFAKVTFMAVRKGRSSPFIFIPQLAVLLQNSQRFLFCFQTSLTRPKPSNYRGITKPCGRTLARELCNNV